jgi:hypothetical protein
MSRYACLLTLFSISISLACSGCVRRRLTVRTQPPGASVYVDKQYIGTSPTATSTIYYGTREIEVVRDGYRTEKVLRTFNPPWYQLPPLDFVSETLWPRKIRDERIIDVTMVPQQVMTSEQLQSRASSLRLQAAQGVATPLPPTAGVSSLPGVAAPAVVPIDPTFQAQPGPIVTSPTPVYPPPQSGGFLQEFFQPGGMPPTRIPEAGILPGGGYRPET